MATKKNAKKRTAGSKATGQRSAGGNRQKHPSSGRNRVVVVLACVIIFVLALIAYNLISSSSQRNEMRTALERTTFFDGIYVNDIHIGGMTTSQAKTRLSGVESGEAESTRMSVVYEDMSWMVDSNFLEMSFNTDEVLKKAYSIGRSHSSLEDNYNEVMALKQSPVRLTIESRVNAVELGSLLEDISSAIDIPSKDATVEHFSRDSGFIFSREETGLQVDKQALKDSIISSFMSGNTSNPVAVPVNILFPEVTKEHLEKSYTLIARYQSETTNNSARNQNITLALAAFDGTILGRDEEFSINEKTGERTNAKGYQEAGAIKNGILIPEFGGGVCQVSTALFNAVARADLEITERNNHSYPINYVDIGMDAMIDYPAADFKFVNSTEGDMYIAAWFDSSKRLVNIELYGISPLDDGVTVGMRSEIYETLPQPEDIVRESAEILIGEVEETRTGRTGYRTNTYKQYFKGGSLIGEELLCKSYYRAIAAIYSIGTGIPVPENPEEIPQPLP
ncbi:MAG: VanW family protein [Christensenellales bacterium]|jgi:vancomycin resistance protein YoaR